MKKNCSTTRKCSTKMFHDAENVPQPGRAGLFHDEANVPRNCSTVPKLFHEIVPRRGKCSTPRKKSFDKTKKSENRCCTKQNTCHSLIHGNQHYSKNGRRNSRRNRKYPLSNVRSLRIPWYARQKFLQSFLEGRTCRAVG